MGSLTDHANYSSYSSANEHFDKMRRLKKAKRLVSDEELEEFKKFYDKHAKVAVIAGGKGKRLWPLSTDAHPKQMVFDGEQEFIRNTTGRALACGYDIDDIFVFVADEHQRNLAKKLLVEKFGMLSRNIVVLDREDYDFGGSIHAAILHIEKYDKEAIVTTVASDHKIKVDDSFINSMHDIVYAAKEDMNTTIGVKINDFTQFKELGHAVFAKSDAGSRFAKIQKFVEKPKEDEGVDELMRTGNSLANTAISAWKASSFINVMGRNPKPMDTGELMSKFDNLYILEGKFYWKDCGTWKEYYAAQDEKSANHAVVEIGGEIQRRKCYNALLLTPKNSVSSFRGGDSFSFVQAYDEDILVTLVISHEKSYMIKEILENNKLEDFLKSNNSFASTNCTFHTASLVGQAICIFVGMDNVHVSVERFGDKGIYNSFVVVG